MMRLVKFPVTNFRSVEDSGWIETDTVTAFIGTNELGKTNLIVPLWKLHPAQEGEIDLLTDAPRKRYNAIRSMERKPIFIAADFELPDDLVQAIVKLTGAAEDDVRIARVQRDLGGKCYITFPEAQVARSTSRSAVEELLALARETITQLDAYKTEESLRAEMLAAIESALAEINERAEDDELVGSDLGEIKKILETVDMASAAKRSTIVPRYGQLIDDVTGLQAAISKPAPGMNEKARQLVLANLPSSECVKQPETTPNGN